MKKPILIAAGVLALLFLVFLAFFRFTISNSQPTATPVITETAIPSDDTLANQLRIHANGFELKTVHHQQKGSFSNLRAALQASQPHLQEQELLVRIQPDASFNQVEQTLNIIIKLGLTRYRLVKEE